MRTTAEQEKARQKKLEYLKNYRRRPENLARHREVASKWRQSHREQVSAYIKAWKAKNPDRIREYQEKYNAKRIGKKYYPDNAREFARRRRIKVLKHYGGNSPKCVCCGEGTIEFLALDHIHGGGNKHRAEVGRGNMMGWIVKNKFPPIFQVMCHNCNSAKAYYGKCPHTGL